MQHLACPPPPSPPPPSSMCTLICLTKPSQLWNKCRPWWRWWSWGLLADFCKARCSVNMKWRVATHSDHSCRRRVAQRLRRCNLICLSCKVKAFIIPARGERCHLHWTWHVHTPLTMGGYTHTCTPIRTQTLGDDVERWRLWGEDGQKDRINCEQRSQGQLSIGVM